MEGGMDNYVLISLPLFTATNTESIALWEKTGFRRLAIVPAAAQLKGEEELVDAHMYHYDLTTYT